ncbi:RagB/SusD family nutrient uptake outer membrane protein [Pseudoflavitalea sp. G-6-1-2]|uniref:RagB/SusD family nutrient uptake outer membrane protein n=1 Tax=Pseudoflavitalea sp. G-6-1-2 TaxID=2728841 RepID=UPI00146DB3ED|nr:RagB/SusD family nutrient uptake outer membrane protein [Pseudoflavitalea sp. G-6-1-2]NML22733.1 RagB/SusD family nutrient uptake outer membrane protein [Pseudoflavitalea sp. G-6-1-2]
MNIRNIFLFTMATTLASSCQKFLDVKPKGKLIPETVSDFDHLLDNSATIEYNFVDQNRGSLLSTMGDNLVMTEGQAKVGYVLSSHPNIERYYGYIFRQPYKDPNNNDPFWSAGSSGIYTQMSYFNHVIEGIRGIKDLTPEDAASGRRTIAQALVARTWCYFNANLIYGPVYKPGGDNSAKTIPYVTNPDIYAPIPNLSTSEEVMARVLAELHEALPSLPAKSTWPSRASKPAGYAMLAYYHLFTRKYDSVAHYANLAWTAGAGSDPGKVLYDYREFKQGDSNINIIRRPIIAKEDGYLNQVNSRELLLYRHSDKDAGMGSQLSYPSPELLALYDQANDLRFKEFYINSPGYKTGLGGGFNDGMRISNYRFNKAKITDGFSWPEVLLMRAEAYARNNQAALAIADLNTLRRYRMKKGTPDLPVGTAEEALMEVVNERRRELPIGGLKRFMDLKRFSLEPGKPWSKATITHTLSGQTYTATVDSKDFVIPISNVVLKFNPGWGIPLEPRTF